MPSVCFPARTQNNNIACQQAPVWVEERSAAFRVIKTRAQLHPARVRLASRASKHYAGAMKPTVLAHVKKDRFRVKGPRPQWVARNQLQRSEREPGVWSPEDPSIYYYMVFRQGRLQAAGEPVIIVDANKAAAHKLAGESGHESCLPPGPPLVHDKEGPYFGGELRGQGPSSREQTKVLVTSVPMMQGRERGSRCSKRPGPMNDFSNLRFPRARFRTWNHRDQRPTTSDPSWKRGISPFGSKRRAPHAVIRRVEPCLSAFESGPRACARGLPIRTPVPILRYKKRRLAACLV